MKRHFKEPLLFYLVACIVNYVYFKNDPAFLSVELHPYLFATILFGLRYGLWEAILTAVIGVGLLVWANLQQQLNLEMEMIYGLEHMVLPFTILIMGIIVGELTETRIKKMEYYQGALRREISANMAQTKENMAMEQSLLELEKKLAGHGIGIRDFSDKLSVMMSLDRAAVYRYIPKLLETFLGVQRSVVLISDPDIYHQHPVQHPVLAKADTDLDALRQHAVYRKMLTEKRPVSLSEVVDGYEPDQAQESTLFFAGPIILDDGGIDAIILVVEMPFIQFSTNNFKLFEVILNSARMVINNKQLYQGLLEAAPYHPQWLVEREHYFYKHLKEALSLREKGEVILVGFEFGADANEKMKYGFWTLLAQLSILSGGRVGHLQSLNVFMVYHVQKKAQDLERDLLRRYFAYGFSEGYAKLKIVPCTMTMSMMSREIGAWVNQCSKIYEGKV